MEPGVKVTTLWSDIFVASFKNFAVESTGWTSRSKMEGVPVGNWEEWERAQANAAPAGPAPFITMS